jgi:hypothetical protein
MTPRADVCYGTVAIGMLNQFGVNAKAARHIRFLFIAPQP